MAHRRNLGAMRQALVVMDGLALDQWLLIERRLRSRRPDLLIDTRACFAWLPTLTGVSRQAIFAGEQPRAFAKSVGNTAGEPLGWRRFWENENLDANDVYYAKGLGQPGSCRGVIDGPIADGVEIIGIVVDTVDRILHGETFGKRSMRRRIEEWLTFGEWDLLVDRLIAADYQIIITSDHGNVEAVGMGVPVEGSLAEERGERVRIYDSEVLRQRYLASNSGTKALQPGGLPESYRPLFAPYGCAFLPTQTTAVTHGGTAMEEVIVPFVRVSRKESE
ncbi:MAG: BREX-3 system phosphatase PglZ [Alphaproteobacteria bacterium]|nr:MAG: BREX-3 system phosphatase PglZ [Alphaproteobacteria bacterium]